MSVIVDQVSLRLKKALKGISYLLTSETLVVIFQSMVVEGHMDCSWEDIFLENSCVKKVF